VVTAASGSLVGFTNGAALRQEVFVIRFHPQPNRPNWPRVAPYALTALVAMTTVGACTKDARTDLARRTFIAAVNLKCKVTKSEAKLAWNIADDLGAGAQATKTMASARAATDKLLAEIDRIDGPADITGDVKSALRSSSDVVAEVLKGTTTIDDGKAKLDALRSKARDEGFGDCVG
jgi:hypothetical protein